MSTSATPGRVVIGMDPHKRSATIEVMAADEAAVGGGRFATDRDGYAEMRRYAGRWTDRVTVRSMEQKAADSVRWHGDALRDALRLMMTSLVTWVTLIQPPG